MGDHKYERHELIGKGSFGQVHRGVRTDTGEPVAIKTINLEDAEEEIEIFEGNLEMVRKGEIDELGRLKLTGRIKEIFKTSKGKYVAPFPIESKLLADAHVEQVCVVGNAMPQPIALVALSESDLAALQEGASRESIHQDLIKLYEQVNATLDPHEKLKTIVVTNGEWSIENGIMTPTLKIKRNVLESRYEDRIENWYDSKEKVQWE